MGGDPAFVVERLRERMVKLAGQQRFEEAAMTRDRLSALLGAIRRTQLFATLALLGRAEITHGDTTWIIADGALVDTRTATTLTAALPSGPLGTIEVGRPVPREHADEALCLAKFFDKHATRLTVTCDGQWRFPIAQTEAIPPLERAA